MPAAPIGGLSLFLNLTIIFVGAATRFLRKKGYALTRFYAFLAIFNAQRFDRAWRRAFGYGLCVLIVSYLFALIGISFALRLQDETNIDLISNAMSVHYEVKPTTMK